MISKMGTPLGSPTLAATTLAGQLRNRLPTQLRRSLPFYVACVFLTLIVFNLGLFRGPPSGPNGGGKLFSSTSPFGGLTSRPRSEFPPKIWQVWKTNPLNFEARDHDVARSWVDHNPDWRYEVVTDDSQNRYVEYHFGPEGFNRPDIVDFYRNVRAAIVKADLLRYLIMYAEGGVYADIDVEAIRPMNKFIPERYDVRDIDMVIGIEIDEPDWRDHPILGPKSRSFCQWTFMCKPQLPVMMRLVEQIMAWLTEVARAQKVPLSEVALDFDEIISGTGPSAFTAAILAEMNAQNQLGHEITWDTFHDMSESKIVGRTLVLTVQAFAAGQGHSDSGNHESRQALVRHHYHASNWPSRHPRYQHPAYGQIEDCNWNDECVHKWDEDVAAFKTLDETTQKRIIAEKEKEREEKKKEEERKRKEEEEETRKKEEDERREKEEKEAEIRRKKDREDEEAAKKAEREGGEKKKATKAGKTEKEKEKETETETEPASETETETAVPAKVTGKLAQETKKAAKETKKVAKETKKPTPP
jgi:mannosyltransferase OCH1-like enzyme